MAPSLACKCKVAMCSTCRNCSRCGCDHDGLSVESKLARKRGRGCQSSNDEQLDSQARKKRATNVYQVGALVESPYVPFKKKLVKAKATARKILYNIAETMSKQTIGQQSVPDGVFQTPADVMRAFGLGDKVDALYAHIPTVNFRSIPSTWEDHNDSKLQHVFSSFKSLLLRISTVFCGMSEIAGEVFLSGFVRSQKLDEQAQLKRE